MENLQTGIIGASGRLGSVISKLCNSRKITPESDLKEIHLCIDVSKADVIKNFLPKLMQANIPIVVGSTGHSKETLEALEKASLTIPVLIAPNFSKGIYLMKQALLAIPSTPTSITETHHIHKKDAPSGTGKLIHSLYANAPQVTSHRIGEEFGTHTVTFKLPFETLEITHKAESLELFAHGAIAALFFLSKKGKGLYTMDDVYKKEEHECTV